MPDFLYVIQFIINFYCYKRGITMIIRQFYGYTISDFTNLFIHSLRRVLIIFNLIEIMIVIINT